MDGNISEVETKFSVQTVQTLIWATGSTSKGVRRGSGRGICKSVITQFKGGRLTVKLPNPPGAEACADPLGGAGGGRPADEPW